MSLSKIRCSCCGAATVTDKETIQQHLGGLSCVGCGHLLIDHLPNVAVALDKAWEAIGMLNSMVRSGETHSESSQKVVDDAKEAMRNCCKK
jgi:hypothetical protein